VAVTIVAIIAVIVVVILGFAATKPNVFRVERAASMRASVETVFSQINDLGAWGAWSPWEKKDPTMKKSFSGPMSGKGATYEWDGDKKVGKGRMEITDTEPPSKVIIKLDFIKPFEGHNITEFTMEPKGETVLVTWSMHGPQPFIGKVMSVFINCDKMVGGDFEAGLANLKAVVEK
jgi:hypothetical protein